MNIEGILDAFTLRSTEGLGDKGFKRLVDGLGSPTAALGADQAELEDVCGASELLFRRIRTAAQSRELFKKRIEINFAKGFSLTCYGASDYPARLAEISDPPSILYSAGCADIVSDSAVAVVGSRRPTFTGIRFARKLCACLAEAGVIIISGLASGIDSAAHHGALDANGLTAAVFGCGLDIIYPAKNKKLANDMLAKGGAWFSELPLGVEPKPHHFPRRNRIISGAALGVIVVEAAENSGSLITASLALDHGREVFAVPGLPGSHCSKGAHQLLRAGAVLVESADDVLRELRLGKKGEKNNRADLKNSPPPPPSALWTALEETPMHIDELADMAGVAPAVAAAELMELTLNGYADELPGKRYRKNSP